MDTQEAAMRFDEAARSLGAISQRFNISQKLKSEVQEIRLRVGKPVVLSLPSETAFVNSDGTVLSSEKVDTSNTLTAYRENMEEAFRLICNFSVHSHQREIRNGFVTIKGGHRAGICGTAVTENDLITNIKDITSINLRIARDIKGAAKETAASITRNGFINGSLVFGPPGCGKTTVLRDLARLLSSGKQNRRFYRVAVIDERGELAACYQGIPQNDLGPCCDILDGYPKGEGIIQAVRCLSPDVIICDEIGGEDDERAIEASLNAGVSVIASAHAGSISELNSRPQIKKLIATGAFKYAVRLYGREKPGTVAETINLLEMF